MKFILFFLGFSLIFSCEKEVLKAQKNVVINKSIEPAPKIELSGTLVLVPAGGYPRIQFLPDGPNTLISSQITNGVMVRGVFSSSGTPLNYVKNPSLIAGLPDYLSIHLTGLAVNRSIPGTASEPELILSTGLNGYKLLFATRNISGYIVNSFVNVNFALAIPNSDWYFSDIEYKDGYNVMYGIFYNPSLNRSLIANINKLTGNCTLVKQYDNTKIIGLELLRNSSLNNLILIATSSALGSQGTIINLDLNSLTSVSQTLNVPVGGVLSGSVSASARGSFVSKVGISSTRFYINDEEGHFWVYDILTNSVISPSLGVLGTISENVILTQPSTFWNLLPIYNSAQYTDAAN